MAKEMITFLSGLILQIGAILYGEFGSDGFSNFHSLLSGLVQKSKVDYILRPYVIVSCYLNAPVCKRVAIR